jgi:aldehyde dehydrogenase (NAD+)
VSVATIAELFTSASLEFGPAPESDAPARAWLAMHGGVFDHNIGGRWTEPGTGERFDSIDPSTGAVLGRVAQGNAADIDAAVRAAREA